jgi:hypothetical protein
MDSGSKIKQLIVAPGRIKPIEMQGCSEVRQPKYQTSNIKHQAKRTALSYIPPATTVLLALLIFLQTSCHQGPGMMDAALEPATRLNDPEPVGFWPTDVTVLPLTIFWVPPEAGAPPYIHLYVGLRDPYGCFTKAPGIFRVELYERMPRADQAKGRRLSIWPDIDIHNPDENQAYWRDYLRCYELRLDLAPRLKIQEAAILEVTFLGANKERLTTLYTLELGQG